MPAPGPNRSSRTAAPGASELLPLPVEGRRFDASRPVRLGDVDPSGRLRLDAIARYLQDVANDDALDARLPDAFAWVVRRTLIAVTRMPRLGERLSATTCCSGIGRSWAERRTSLVGDAHGAVDAVSLWVHVDAVTGRPTTLGEAFAAIYGATAAGRRVSARLVLPDPAESTSSRRWWVRRADLDVLGHVNNAVSWAVIHELIADDQRRVGTGEVEHLAPIDPDDSPLELRWQTDGSGATTAWLIADGGVRTAMRWRPGAPADTAPLVPEP